MKLSTLIFALLTPFVAAGGAESGKCKDGIEGQTSCGTSISIHPTALPHRHSANTVLITVSPTLPGLAEKVVKCEGGKWRTVQVCLARERCK